MTTEILAQPKTGQYTGNEAIAIIDQMREMVDDHTRLDPLEVEFATLNHHLRTRGAGVLSLLYADDNDAGTFKWRGAIVGASGLEADIIAVPSAGNHARGAVLATKILKRRTNVVVPRNAPPAKKEGLYQLGARHLLTVHAKGDDFNQSLDWVYAHPELGTVLHPFDDDNVIAGQGTIADDLMRLAGKNSIDHIVLPVGGGGLLAGITQRLDELGNHHTQLHAIEPEGSTSLSQSLKEGRQVEVATPNQRYGGSAVRKIGDHTFKLIQTYQDRINVHQVTDGDVNSVISDYQFDRRSLWHDTTPALEPTTLVAVAGIEHVVRRYPGESIVVIGTGHNAPLEPTPLQHRGTYVLS